MKPPVAAPAADGGDGAACWGTLPGDILGEVFSWLDEEDVEGRPVARASAGRSTSSSAADKRSTAAAVRRVCAAWRAAHRDAVTHLAPSSAGGLNLAQFPNLRCLNLRACGRRGDGSPPQAALRVLPSLRHLTSLDLAGASLLNDAMLAALAGGLPRLRHLVLDRCDRVSDRGLTSLAPLTALETLSLAACCQVGNAGVAAVAALPALTDLDLSRLKAIDNRAVASLAQHGTPLARLTLAWNRELTNGIVDSLLDLPTLTALQLTRLREVTSGGVAFLAALPALRTLSLQWCDCIDGSQFEGFAPLRALSLSWSDNIIDFGLESIGTLGALRSLDLANCAKITDHGIAALAGLTALRALNLSYCRLLTDASCSRLARLPALESLLLDAVYRLTDRGLRALAAAPRLGYLSLGECSDVSTRAMDRLTAARPGLRLDLGLKSDCAAHFASLLLGDGETEDAAEPKARRRPKPC